MSDEVKLFEGNKIRSVWDNEKEKSELSTIYRQLKLKASDGKMRETDAAEWQKLHRRVRRINLRYFYLSHYNIKT